MKDIWQLKDNPSVLLGDHEDLKTFAANAVANGAEQVMVSGEQAVVMVNNETAMPMPGCVLQEPETKTKTKAVENVGQEDDNSAPEMPPCINADPRDSADIINTTGRTGGGVVDMGQQGIDQFGKRVEESISPAPKVLT